jgi:hypothetical protein
MSRFTVGGLKNIGGATGCGKRQDQDRRETMIRKMTLAIALMFAALASVPASAAPHHNWQMAGNCQEDLGYGRTSGWGCG